MSIPDNHEAGSREPRVASPGRRSILFGLAGTALGGVAGLGLGMRFHYKLRKLRRQLYATEADGRADPEKEAFRRVARGVLARHDQQTVAQAEALRARFAKPVFGKVAPWEATERLARIVDPIDQQLWATSQWIHVLQILAAMEAKGVDDPNFHLMAILHDLGKLVMLTGEPAENFYGRAHVLGEHEPGVGLLNVPLMFSHPEFMYMRLRGRVPEHVAWTIRHHNIQMADCEPYMDTRDREWAEAYLVPFRDFDQGFKSPFQVPEVEVERYRALLDTTFPDSLVL